MFAQAVITLIIIGLLIWAFFGIVYPLMVKKSKGGESEEIVSLRERIIQKEEELRERRTMSGLMESEVETTQDLIKEEEELAKLKKNLAKLETRHSRSRSA